MKLVPVIGEHTCKTLPAAGYIPIIYDKGDFTRAYLRASPEVNP